MGCALDIIFTADRFLRKTFGLMIRKNLICLVLLLQLAGSNKAQRFFYVEKANGAEQAIKENLVASSQFVTDLQIASDYIIRTEVSEKEFSHALSLKISLVDSANFKTIYHGEEEYPAGYINSRSAYSLNLALSILLEKNMKNIILQARRNYMRMEPRSLSLKRDKT